MAPRSIDNCREEMTKRVGDLEGDLPQVQSKQNKVLGGILVLGALIGLLGVILVFLFSGVISDASAATLRAEEAVRIAVEADAKVRVLSVKLDNLKESLDKLALSVDNLNRTLVKYNSVKNSSGEQPGTRK